MLEKYEWISSERQFFGQPNTAYDFAGNDMKEVSRRLSKLQETKEKLGKNVNMRAMNMLGKAEEKVEFCSLCLHIATLLLNDNSFSALIFIS